MMPLVLTATIAGTPVAIPSDHVESVVRIGPIVPIPCVARGIVGLFAVRSRVLTLYDPGQPMRTGPVDFAACRAVVLGGEGAGHAMLVDDVADVRQHDGTTAATERLPDHWATIAAGVIDFGSERRILIDVTATLQMLVAEKRAA
jgi:purine-binding chemotaxis protein CheW